MHKIEQNSPASASPTKTAIAGSGPIFLPQWVQIIGNNLDLA